VDARWQSVDDAFEAVFEQTDVEVDEEAEALVGKF
jgi:hypothetical protein